MMNQLIEKKIKKLEYNIKADKRIKYKLEEETSVGN